MGLSWSVLLPVEPSVNKNITSLEMNLKPGDGIVDPNIELHDSTGHCGYSFEQAKLRLVSEHAEQRPSMQNADFDRLDVHC